MAAFNFKLQRVLDVRKLEEEQAKYKYYKEKQEEKKLKNEITFLQNKQDNVFQYLRENDNSVDDNIRARNYIYLQRKKIDMCEERLELQREKVNNIQQKLLEKKKKKKMMKELKNKAKNIFYKEFYDNQQKILDEISLNFSKR